MPRLFSERPGFRTAIICALLFAGTVALFVRATHFGFLNYDDPAYVTENAHVQGGLSWSGVVWAFTAPADYWHPLTWLSHMLDWQLFGPKASGHHLTSVLWHALNAVLVFLVFRRFGASLWPAAVAAALFAWHPLRVESVVWISERKDVMSGCFFLLTLLAYGRYVGRCAAGRPRWRAYLLTLACFVAGLMSKPMLVTLPLILLVLDYWPFARPAASGGLRRLLFEKVPFFLFSGAAGVATLLMQQNIGAFVLNLPFGARAGNAVVSLARYLGKFVWPFDLAVCYPHPASWPVWAVLGATALVLGLSWLAWRERRRRPWIAVGWLWFVIVLLPVLGLIQVGFQAMADRYTYLSLLGIEVAALWSLEPVWRTRGGRLGASAVAAAVLAACVARTWNQEGVWRTSVSLFTHAVAVTHDNDVAQNLLASALFASGRVPEAAAHAERACALNPRNANARIMLASIRERQGKIAEAAALLRKALALRPDNPDAKCQLGLMELRLGHAGEARRLMSPVLRASATVREQTVAIARGAQMSGDLDKALFLFDLVRDITPDDPAVLVDVAGVHAQRREFAAAERLCRRAIALAPNDARAHAVLGYVLIYGGDRAAGLAEWRRALKLDPGFPGLREQLRKASQAP